MRYPIIFLLALLPLFCAADTHRTKSVHLTSLEAAYTTTTKTSDEFDVSAYLYVTALVYFSVSDTAAGTLYLDQSPDGTTWITADSTQYSITDTLGAVQVEYSPIMSYVRIKLKNTSGSGTVSAAHFEAKS